MYSEFNYYEAEQRVRGWCWQCYSDRDMELFVEIADTHESDIGLSIDVKVSGRCTVCGEPALPGEVEINQV